MCSQTRRRRSTVDSAGSGGSNSGPAAHANTTTPSAIAWKTSDAGVLFGVMSSGSANGSLASKRASMTLSQRRSSMVSGAAGSPLLNAPFGASASARDKHRASVLSAHHSHTSSTSSSVFTGPHRPSLMFAQGLPSLPPLWTTNAEMVPEETDVELTACSDDVLQTSQLVSNESNLISVIF